jgi:hypothetical protein
MTVTEQNTKKDEIAEKKLLLEALVYSVAKSPDAKFADDLISMFYTDIKEKFNFLRENFNFRIVCGSKGIEDVHEYYGLAIQYILSEVRDWGIESIIKTNT